MTAFSAGGLLWVVGAFLLALGVLIVVHELGHYAVARLCNVKILRFSVGFGKPLLVKRFGADGTEWALAAFPLGGYVKMLDEREGAVVPEELPRAFNRQGLGRRSLIVLAGPAANLLLAIILYWFLFVNGVEEWRPVLAAPPAGSVAAVAKVGAGETVLTVSGTPVSTWMEMRWELLRRILDHEVAILETIDGEGRLLTHRLDTAAIDTRNLDKDLLPALGLSLMRPELPPVIGEVNSGSPAAAAGLAAGDRVLSIDGNATPGWSDVARRIRESGSSSLAIEFERAGRILRADVVPERTTGRDGKPVARIGIAVRDDPAIRSKSQVTVRYDALTALQKSLTQTWETSALSLRMIGRMLTGELSVKSISGPVTIADYAGQSARLGGDHYLRFLALISISLGVLNLLPIPVLDGGHLLYYLAEYLKGSPLPERAMEIGQQVGVILLALLMSLAFYNDINRLVFG